MRLAFTIGLNYLWAKIADFDETMPRKKLRGREKENMRTFPSDESLPQIPTVATGHPCGNPVT